MTSSGTIADLAGVLRHFGLPADADLAALRSTLAAGTACGAFIEPLDPDDGDGVAIGSIVEGSDLQTETYRLAYPFPATELDAAVAAVEDEATEIWHAAHCHARDCVEPAECPGCPGPCACVGVAAAPRPVQVTIAGAEAVLDVAVTEVEDDPDGRVGILISSGPTTYQLLGGLDELLGVVDGLGTSLALLKAQRTGRVP